MQITPTLARFVVEHRAADVPPKIRHEATRSFLNWVGCAVGGSRDEAVQRALDAFAGFSGPPQATVLGRDERRDILQAALINGIAGHTLDFDDTHLSTVIHPAGPVAAALLALAEFKAISGAEFLHAFILGVEVECRVGRAVYPSHYDLGWHISSTTGVFGAAAAAGRLLGLDEQQMTWALGLAATQASGLREMFGTMSKPFHIGQAAKNGLQAALLAAKNFTSSDQGLEAPRGFAHVLAPTRNLAVITNGLGKSWEIAFNTYKPFACGIVIHPVIEACIELRNTHQLAEASIESIAAAVHPLVLELTGKRTPRTGLEGKFSVYHSAAAAILRGDAGVAEFSDACVRDPEVIALRERVIASVASDLHEDQARVAIRLADGRVFEKLIEHAIGSIARPIDDAGLEAKFRGLTKGILSPGETDRLIHLAWNVGRIQDLHAVARGTIPAPRGERP